jgi:hypothetical protein
MLTVAQRNETAKCQISQFNTEQYPPGLPLPADVPGTSWTKDRRSHGPEHKVPSRSTKAAVSRGRFAMLIRQFFKIVLLVTRRLDDHVIFIQSLARFPRGLKGRILSTG